MNELIQAIADKNTLIAVMVDDEHVILDLNGKREMVSCWDLLAAASDADNKKCSWEILHFASGMFERNNGKTFAALYDAVATEVTWNAMKREKQQDGNKRNHKRGAAK